MTNLTSTQKAQREEILRKVRAKAGTLAELMNLELGRKLIESLEETFYDGSMIGDDPYMTYFRLGQRDVVDFLKQLQRIHERET